MSLVLTEDGIQPPIVVVVFITSATFAESSRSLIRISAIGEEWDILITLNPSFSTKTSSRRFARTSALASRSGPPISNIWTPVTARLPPIPSIPRLARSIFSIASLRFPLVFVGWTCNNHRGGTGEPFPAPLSFPLSEGRRVRLQWGGCTLLSGLFGLGRRRGRATCAPLGGLVLVAGLFSHHHRLCLRIPFSRGRRSGFGGGRRVSPSCVGLLRFLTGLGLALLELRGLWLPLPLLSLLPSGEGRSFVLALLPFLLFLSFPSFLCLCLCDRGRRGEPSGLVRFAPSESERLWPPSQ